MEREAIVAAFDAPVCLVGGGPVDPADLAAARALAPHLVAADGGADALAAQRLRPDAILGDMDSMRGTAPAGVPLHRIADQGSTDFEKCLRHVAAPLYLGVGFLGARLDHTLAAMHALIAHAKRRVILIGGEDVCFAAPLYWAMEIDPGSRVSVYPVRPCQALGSNGLRWPLDGLTLAGGTLIGTSNEAVASRIAIRFAEPGAVTILPKRCLGAVAGSLVAD